MRKSKIVLLIAAALAALLLLTSCGGSTVAVKNLLIEDAKYTDESTVYTTGALVSDLNGADYESYQGNLVYFTAEEEVGTKTYDKHIVYDVKANKVIYTATETSTTNIMVSLRYGQYPTTGEEYAYFMVYTTSWKLDEKELKIGRDSYKTALYDAAGAKVAEANREQVAVSTVYDLIYFDGKCYTVSEAGVMTYAFDYSALADLPSVDEKYGEYYYELEAEYVAVYDAQLKLVSKYYAPMAGKIHASVVLENGNVLIQYTYAVDEYGDDYTLMFDDDKLMLKTEIVNAEKGTAKVVEEFNYVLARAFNTLIAADEYAKMGIDAEKLGVYGMACEIVDRRASEELSQMISISNKGAVSELEDICGEPVEGFSLVADGVWRITTEDHAYLMNAKGEITADISNASRWNNLLYSDGKIYDYSLNVVYDYAANDLIWYGSTEKGMLFKNADNELVLYNGSENLVEIIDKDADRELISNNGRYLVILDETNEEAFKYEFYSSKGDLVLTINENEELTGYYYNDYSVIFSNKNGALVSSVNAEGDTVYYRLG